MQNEGPKISEKDAFQFCEENRMKLWYPSRPFQNVTDHDRKLINAFSHRTGNVLFWSSIKRINTTHFETPINEIVLQEWIEIENGEIRNVFISSYIISGRSSKWTFAQKFLSQTKVDGYSLINVQFRSFGPSNILSKSITIAVPAVPVWLMLC